MDEEDRAPPPNYLVDTGVFILWYRGEKVARDFFRHPPGRLYYSKQTRKELLRPPISDLELRTVKRFLRRFRMVNPDDTIARAFSELLAKYPYLRDHLPDPLIAATAWAKEMILVTTNPRHFKPIKEIRIAIFPDEFAEYKGMIKPNARSTGSTSMSSLPVAGTGASSGARSASW